MIKQRITIIFLCLVSVIINCKAQTISIEQARSYRDSGTEIPDGTYIKDINHRLDKYVGVWKGHYGGRSYEFRIEKLTHFYLGISEDILTMRYKIAELLNGQKIIENTLNLSFTSAYVIKGDYLAKTGSYYVLYYIGKEADCGQSGDVLIEVVNNGTQMKLSLEPENQMILAKDCPNGPADQILPTEEMTLTKQ